MKHKKKTAYEKITLIISRKKEAVSLNEEEIPRYSRQYLSAGFLDVADIDDESLSVDFNG